MYASGLDEASKQKEKQRLEFMMNHNNYFSDEVQRITDLVLNKAVNFRRNGIFGVNNPYGGLANGTSYLQDQNFLNNYNGISSLDTETQELVNMAKLNTKANYRSQSIGMVVIANILSKRFVAIETDGYDLKQIGQEISKTGITTAQMSDINVMALLDNCYNPYIDRTCIYYCIANGTSLNADIELMNSGTIDSNVTFMDPFMKLLHSKGIDLALHVSQNKLPSGEVTTNSEEFTSEKVIAPSSGKGTVVPLPSGSEVPQVTFNPDHTGSIPQASSSSTTVAPTEVPTQVQPTPEIVPQEMKEAIKENVDKTTLTSLGKVISLVRWGIMEITNVSPSTTPEEVYALMTTSNAQDIKVVVIPYRADMYRKTLKTDKAVAESLMTKMTNLNDTGKEILTNMTTLEAYADEYAKAREALKKYLKDNKVKKSDLKNLFDSDQTFVDLVGKLVVLGQEQSSVVEFVNNQSSNK